VMVIYSIGLLITDINFIFVSLNSRKLPGQYWFLIVGPVLEGCLGGKHPHVSDEIEMTVFFFKGMTAGMAAMHAYVSDTTSPAAR